MYQLSFELPEIDREKTKSAVEATLENYRICLLVVPEEKIPKITPTYSMELPTFTNQFHSQTESAAIDKVDQERSREKYIEWVRKGINRLRGKEREIIVKRYLLEEEVYDYQLYNELGMSERKYYRIKARAFYNLARALKIEEYVGEVVTSA